MKLIIRGPWIAESLDSVLELDSKRSQAMLRSPIKPFIANRSPKQFLLSVTLSFLAIPGLSQNPPAKPDLTELPIETLLGIEVTSVARHSERLSQSPAAIAVITEDDIRRSGALNIPEALRLVPGMEVARLDSSQWAVSARGFNDVFANKLLVLQDGRSIYTPLFSGVFWDVQGSMLEDLERIEVIRGPGATLWGANAVNGVINIISRSSKDTQGVLITGGAGNEERGFGGVRYGGKLSDNAFFRVYGTYFNRDDSALPNGASANDAWQLGRWGFRVDWDVSEQNLITIQGDAYRGDVHQVFGTFDPNATNFFRIIQDDFEVVGGNILGRWSHTISPNSDFRLQAYYDRTERDTVIFREKRDTFDIDAQHRFLFGERNELVWGAGYRVTTDKVGNSPTISLNPDHRTLNLFSAFGQDEITLVPERLRLTVGSKFEHNDFTGFEIQPSGRLLFTPRERQTFWASVSRAVRTPSRAEDDVILNQVVPAGSLGPGSPAFVTTIYGNRNFVSEELLAYELGYRFQPHKTLSLDLAAFYNDYDHLRSQEPGPSPTQPLVGPAFPLHVDNNLYGETYGVEAAATWEIAQWWRLQPSYTFIDMQLHRRSGSADTTSEQDEGKSPRHQFMLRSSMELPHNLSLDAMLRFVDSLPALHISSYLSLDVRLGWRPKKNLELAIVGQNLLHEQHAEFAPSFISTQRSQIERGCYGKITWGF